jgi:peptide deformylase
MAIKQLLEIGDKRLKQNNKKIINFNDSKIKELIQDLIDTMRHYELIGIAAPQIGENLQVFITEPRETATRTSDQSDELRIYINPELIESSNEEIVIYEGCGCIPNASIFGPVSRPKWIKVQAFDEKGNNFEFKANGILGRVIQHELDHLLGIEFIQKVKDNSELMSHTNYIEQIKFVDWHKKNSEITIKKFKRL